MERIFTLSAGTPVAAAIAAVITATSSPSFAALPAAGAAVRAGAAAGAAVCTGAGAAAGASAPAFLAFTFASISLTFLKPLIIKLMKISTRTVSYTHLTLPTRTVV